jgi:ankyrin repeat protein
MNSDDSPTPPIDYDTAEYVLHKAILDRHPLANNHAAKTACLTTMCGHFPGFHPDVTVIDVRRSQEKATFINVACHRGDLRTARDLFFLGAELCNRDEIQRTLPIILCLSLSAKRLSERQQLLQSLLSKPEVRRLINAQDSYGNTALHYASSQELVQTLLVAGADVDILNNMCLNAFVCAAKMCNETKLFLLLETGSIDVNERFRPNPKQRRISALVAVCRFGKRSTALASATVLIEAGADVKLGTNHNGCGGASPLQTAAFYGSVALVSLLIDHGADTSELDLMAHACHNRLNADSNTLDDLKGIVQLLLAANVSINARNLHGMTALMGTSLVDVVRLLVSHGADVNAISSGSSNAKGMSVLMHACSRKESLAVVAFLAERVADINAAVATDAPVLSYEETRGKTALYFACVAPDTAYKRVVVLLAAGATPCVAPLLVFVAPCVAPLLVFAARNACYTVFKRLFVAADEAGGLRVEGILHACASRASPSYVEERKIVEFILKHPDIANCVDALDEFGRTPLLRTDDVGIAVCLVAAGANVNAVNPITGTSLLGQNIRHLDMMRFLLSCDHINVNAANYACATPVTPSRDKVTALHVAARHSYGLAAMNLLIDAGATVNAANSLGDTALHLVAKINKCKSIQNLIKAGASLTFLNNVGEKPVDCVKNATLTSFVLLTNETRIAEEGSYTRPPTHPPTHIHTLNFFPRHSLYAWCVAPVAKRSFSATGACCNPNDGRDCTGVSGNDMPTYFDRHNPGQVPK